MVNWKGSALTYVQSNFSNDKMNDFLRANNRITLFFSVEVPIKVFHSIVPLTQDDLPEISFNRLVIDWSKVTTNNAVTLYF